MIAAPASAIVGGAFKELATELLGELGGNETEQTCCHIDWEVTAEWGHRRRRLTYRRTSERPQLVPLSRLATPG